MTQRPVIFGYDTVPAFVRDMLRYQRSVEPRFSVRRETARLRRCSPTLVSLIASGKRPLTEDRVEDLGKVLRLSAEERGYLKRWLRSAGGTGPKPKNGVKSVPVPTRKRRENHLLSDWLNLYIKDLSRVKGFRPEAETIYRMLGGIASLKHIERSLRFLFREGYLRRTLDGAIVENDVLVTTTDGELNHQIQRAHRKFLDLASKRLGRYPLKYRRESLVVLPLNEEALGELQELLKEFYERLLQFAEDHPRDDERLYQVVMNLTPIGGSA